MRRDELLLDDIRRYAEVARELAGDAETIRDQLALERALFIIGEAAARLSPEAKARIDQPWSEIIGLRNLLAHQYETLRLERLIEIAQMHLPELMDAL